MNRFAIKPHFVLALLALTVTFSAAADDVALGVLSFPNSGAPAAQEHFLRGVKLLHSFEFEDSREAFVAARKADPGFALACWGEAMTHNHPLWTEQDREAALEALRRLAPTPAARLAQAPTEREKDFLRAIEILYGEGDKNARDRAYAEAMRRMHETYPADNEVTTFYALAILGTSSQGRDVSTYLKAAAIVEEVFRKNPQHPGAAHYLIHSYDDPLHAQQGLAAARAYSKIAPAAAHALHMPSHIFLALGMWDDVVEANRRSAAAEDARVARKKLGVNSRGFHALLWLEYAYLQQGRYREAKQLLDTMESDAEQSGSRRAHAHHAYMRAAYLVETRRWSPRPALVDRSAMGAGPAAADLFAEGTAALRSGDHAAARDRFAEIRKLVASTKTSESHHGTTDMYSGVYLPDVQAAAIMGKQLEALLLVADDKAEPVFRLLAEAATAEDALSFEFGPPLPVKPAHELYGEVLLDFGRAAEAREQFQKALARTPRRALSLLGLARAAAAAGDEKMAQESYAELRRVWQHADADLGERAEVFRAAEHASRD